MRATPTWADVINRAITARLEDVNVAIPARVESYDDSTQQVSVQPLIKRGYLDEAEERQVEQLPMITGVPVLFPGGGGFRVTFPVQAGDTVLLVFSQASLDRWLALGGMVDPADDRRHAFSDAIAIPGLRDFAHALEDAPIDRATLGKDGGLLINVYEDRVDVGDGTVPTDGVVHGAGVDPFTGSTYFALGNTSSRLRAKKV